MQTLKSVFPNFFFSDSFRFPSPHRVWSQAFAVQQNNRPLFCLSFYLALSLAESIYEYSIESIDREREREGDSSLVILSVHICFDPHRKKKSNESASKRVSLIVNVFCLLGWCLLSSFSRPFFLSPVFAFVEMRFLTCVRCARVLIWSPIEFHLVSSHHVI